MSCGVFGNRAFPESASFQILRSAAPIASPSAPKTIPEKVSPRSSREKPNPPARLLEKPHRPIRLSFPNPWKRAIRPTDIAFLSSGDDLLATLDGSGHFRWGGEPAEHSVPLGDFDDFLKASILAPAAVIAEGYEAAMPAFAGFIPV
jgi:hypothetical protein